jgi:tetratricopeptide (TPR) repeat protein
MLQDASYQRAVAHARRAEKAGDLAAAARALEPVVERDPRDAGIALELAWIDFRLARYAEAEAPYRLALQRGANTADAHAGLGWTLLRQNRCTEAAESFRVALSLHPSHETARDGMETCARRTAGTMSAWLMGNGYLFPNHPWKARAWGIAPGLSLVPADRFHFAAAYRYVRLRAQAEFPLDPFTQHEAYANIGYAEGAFGAEIHGAMIFGDTGPAGTSPHVGVVGRWSPKGDVILDFTASFYADVTVLRAAPSWRIPVGESFHIVPGVALQHFADEFALSGMATVTFDRPAVGAWAGGKYGKEYRPAYLSSFVIYDVAERNFWGLWAGGRVRLADHLAASISYSFDRMKDAITGELSGIHFVSTGPVVTF